MTNFLSNEAPITILGGGISALSTAFFLIKVGHNPQKITINQKLDTWGGNARTVFVYQNKKEGLHGIMKYDMDVSDPFEPKLLLDLSLDCSNQFPKKALCEEFPERVIKNNKERIVVPLSNNHIIPAESAYIVNSSNYKNYRQIIKELNFYNAYWDNNTRSVITDEFRLDLKGFLYGLWKKPHLLPALIQMSKRLKKLNQASDNYLKKNNLRPDEVTVKKVFDGLGWSHSMYEKMTTIIISCLTGESTEKYNNTFSLN
ncbi:MAG: hypothetical protein MK212_19905, partial [Saprospiraceae bacterium]|nr:hypothetical protein [Saprospiraceae bacterium]